MADVFRCSLFRHLVLQKVLLLKVILKYLGFWESVRFEVECLEELV